jgi:hypothetical protein
MQKNEQKQSPVHSAVAEDVTDCMQCLITLYGETHIDTLAQLLNLTAYAETEFSHLRVQHRP